MPTSDAAVRTNPADAACIFCSSCGEKNARNNFRCTRCQNALHQSAQPQYVVAEESSAAMRMVLPIGLSPWAIASGYLALFSLLLLPAPLALLTGILAVRDIRNHNNKHGMGRAVFGIVLGGIGTAVLTVVLIAKVFQ